MERSPLYRLPDIVALARERARTLMAQHGAPPVRASALAPENDRRRVRLLSGDPLAVMLGLLQGQRHAQSLRAQVALIWMAQADAPSSPMNALPLSPAQRRAVELLDLAVHLFVARELLARDGVLALPVAIDPERCVERTLLAVFGHAAELRHPDPAGPEHRVYLSRASTAAPEPPHGPALLRDLVAHHAAPGTPVLVAPADAACAPWVAALDRHWLLVQPDALRFALLREQVIAWQMRHALAEEPPEERHWSVWS